MGRQMGDLRVGQIMVPQERDSHVHRLVHQPLEDAEFENAFHEDRKLAFLGGKSDQIQ